MTNNLIEKYLKHSKTEEGLAVLFVKKYLNKAQGHWIDIFNARRFELRTSSLDFKYANGALFKRRLKPQYPPKAKYTINGKFNEQQYYLAIRAITWMTANEDIEQQTIKGINPLCFSITGERYERNKSEKNYFRDDAPPEIKALAANLRDRTNPLWDLAFSYKTEPDFEYKIKKVRIYKER